MTITLRYICSFLFALTAATIFAAPVEEALPLPSSAEAQAGAEIVLSVRENQVRVQHADGLTLTVYDIAGVKVATYRIDSEDKTLTLHLTRGIYIIKVGKVARRINIL